MKRILFALLAVAGLLVVAPQDLWAHGGQFRGPGGAVPPGLREPSDPTPPPPPPPSGPPTTPTPTTPTPTAPAPTTPTPTPNAPPPVTPEPQGPNTTGGRKTPVSFEDWTFWYNNNKDDIEGLKSALYRLRSTENPLFITGGGGSTNRTSATRLTAKKVETDIIPALLWAMDPANSRHQDTESAAYIALAKIARDPAHITTIQKGLDLDLKRDLIVQESSALGLGLLRRAEKGDQFTARELDKVRDFLFGVFENDKYQDRTRGFAVLSIGLLGDQPTGSGDYATDTQGAQKATTNRIFELLKGKYNNNDLYVGLLMALGLQPQDSVSEDMRRELGDCALKGRLFKDNANNLVRSYAALALGRIGSKPEIETLKNVLEAKRGVDVNVQRSAAIGLGLLGKFVTGEDRIDVANVLLRTVDRSKDNSTKNFAIISLAYLIIEDLHSGATDVVGGSKADELILETAEKGKYLQRPFGALAVGLVAREVREQVEIEAYQEFKAAGLKILRDGISSTKVDNRGRAAFCVATGIAEDSRSKQPMIEIVADGSADKELRGYAALGLGLIGEPVPEVVKTIAEAMGERSSEELRRQTAVALGLLGNPKIPGKGMDAVELLLQELVDAKSQNHKGQIVISLARVGDHRAADKLIELLKDVNEQYLTRALSCAGLGLIGDLEAIPSLARISKHVNYRASTDLIDEVLSIL